jgi:O-acetyl-ADP-ribose deacetylase (regulator of RNase III)
MTMKIAEADITTLDVDAIVNAAHETLHKGGGVCGAIHSAAGPELERECRAKYPEGCKPGDAKITAGYNLPARHVIHAVGPRWRDGTSGEEALLASAYRRSLEVLVENGLKSIAFPAISTGIFGFPADHAAIIAVETVRVFLEGHPEVDVMFCCRGGESLAWYRTLLPE